MHEKGPGPPPRRKTEPCPNPTPICAQTQEQKQNKNPLPLAGRGLGVGVSALSLQIHTPDPRLTLTSPAKRREGDHRPRPKAEERVVEGANPRLRACYSRRKRPAGRPPPPPVALRAPCAVLGDRSPSGRFAVGGGEWCSCHRYSAPVHAQGQRASTSLSARSGHRDPAPEPTVASSLRTQPLLRRPKSRRGDPGPIFRQLSTQRLGPTDRRQLDTV